MAAVELTNCYRKSMNGMAEMDWGTNWIYHTTGTHRVLEIALFHGAGKLQQDT